MYIGETKQPLHKCIAKQKRANSSGHDSNIYLHLMDKVHLFKDSNMKVLAKEDNGKEDSLKEG